VVPGEVSNSPRIIAGGFFLSGESAYLSRFQRADERTRTADLPITSDKKGVAEVCTCLQISHI
jgi:hypothetical protein